MFCKGTKQRQTMEETVRPFLRRAKRQADYFHFAIIIEYHSFDNNRLGSKVGIYHYLHSLVVWFTDVITPMVL